MLATPTSCRNHDYLWSAEHVLKNQIKSTWRACVPVKDYNGSKKDDKNLIIQSFCIQYKQGNTKNILVMYTNTCGLPYFV